ncbi:ricin-type beta-trefoil lectin domain protein [Streptomyces sp. NPDC002643]
MARDERPGDDAPYTESSDARLTALLRGETPIAYAALRELRERHHPSVLAYARLCTMSETAARQLAGEVFTFAAKQIARGNEPSVPWRHQLLLLTARLSGIRSAEAPPPSLLPAFESLQPRDQGLIWYGIVEREPDDRTARLVGLAPEDVQFKQERALLALRQAGLRLRLAASEDPRCQDFRRLIEESVRPDTPRHSPDLRDHMAHCVHCAGAYDELRAVTDHPRAALADGLLPWGGTTYAREEPGEAGTPGELGAPGALGGRDGLGEAGWPGELGGLSEPGEGVGRAVPEADGAPAGPTPKSKAKAKANTGRAKTPTKAQGAAKAKGTAKAEGLSGAMGPAGATGGVEGAKGPSGGNWPAGVSGQPGVSGPAFAAGESWTDSEELAGPGTGTAAVTGAPPGTRAPRGAGASTGAEASTGFGSSMGSGAAAGFGASAGPETSADFEAPAGFGASAGSGAAPAPRASARPEASADFDAAAGIGAAAGFGADASADVEATQRLETQRQTEEALLRAEDARKGAWPEAQQGDWEAAGQGPSREDPQSSWDGMPGGKAGPGRGPGSGTGVGMDLESGMGMASGPGMGPGPEDMNLGPSLGPGPATGIGAAAAAGTRTEARAAAEGGVDEGRPGSRRLVLTSVALGVALAPLLFVLVFSNRGDSSQDSTDSVGTPTSPPAVSERPSPPESPSPTPTPSPSDGERPSKPPKPPAKSPEPPKETPYPSGTAATPSLPNGPLPNGSYAQVVNVGSGLCLDIRGELEKGTDVVTATCSSRDTQRWRFDSHRDVLQSFADPDLCLDSRGATDDGVGIWECDAVESENGQNLRFTIDALGQIVPDIAPDFAVTPDTLGSVSFAKAKEKDGQRWKAGGKARRD